jgi:hypothetical protein
MSMGANYGIGLQLSPHRASQDRGNWVKVAGVRAAQKKNKKKLLFASAV